MESSEVTPRRWQAVAAGQLDTAGIAAVFGRSFAPLSPMGLPAPLPACLHPALPFFCRYDIKAPGMFTTRNVGKTLVTRTAGTKVSPTAHFTTD